METAMVPSPLVVWRSTTVDSGALCAMTGLWDFTNTRVACRELGFLGSSTSWTTSSAGG